MISINVEKPVAKVEEPVKSLSQQKLLRDAKTGAAKKMNNEKALRLKKAGIAK